MVPTQPCTRSAILLLAVALANAGGVIAYLPLFSLLLPMRVEVLDEAAKIDLLTATAIVGGIVASGANVFFGWLSDLSAARGGGRRRWVMGGLAALALSYVVLVLARTPVQLVLAVAFAQAAINAVLAPLFAIVAEEVPARRKGLAGGLLALGNPVAAAFSVVLLAASGLVEMARFALVPGAALVLILPLLALRPERQALAPELAVPWDRRDIVIASISRLLVQLSCATLTLYLLYYFKTLVPAGSDAAGLVGTVLTISYIIPLPVALALGRWSDLSGRRKPFLCGAALVGTAGLLGMAGADNAWQGAAAFCVYATGTAVFLSLHVTFAMQLLPRPDRRGRDLGLVNLTNTAPAIVGTLIVWQLAAPQDFTPVLLAFAAIKGIGAIVILAVRERPRMPAR